MTEAIITRDQQFPFHGSWRENVYTSHRRSAIQEPLVKKSNIGETKEKKKSMQSSEQKYNYQNEKQKLKNAVSDPMYKPKPHLEMKRNVKEPKEKRKLLRKPYESKGPNDERYYVSASSGTDMSQAETEPGRHEEPNMFVKLLHHQVLHYSPKSPESLATDNNEIINKDREATDRNQSSRSSANSKAETNHTCMAPPSPTPDYFENRKSKLVRDKRFVSKSISNLVDKSYAIQNSPRDLSASSLQLSPNIPQPDYEKEKPLRSKERDLWGNANRFRGSQDNLTSDTEEKPKMKAMTKSPRVKVAPTETLKHVLKTRPPVSEFVKEITKVSEKDKIRQRQRENMQKEAESIFDKGKEERNLHELKQKEKKRPKHSVESSSEEDEAKKIYREILEVVKTNAPASLQYGRGRMVGYGEEAQDTLRRGDKKNAVRTRSEKSNHNAFTRMRQSEDRESVTTSIDSYPFSPSSPWAHALPSRYNRFGYPVFPQRSFGLASPSGPVSFAGFSSPTSQSQLTSSSLGPGSLHHHMQQPRRTKPKRKKKWFNIF